MSHNCHNGPHAAATGEAVTCHGTAISVGDSGLLIRGESGSGKSGLALTMLALGAALVADDQVQIAGGCLSAPERIAGMIEARGLGLIRLPARRARLCYVVDLDLEPVGRLPRCNEIHLAGQHYPLIAGKGVPNLASGLMILLKGGQLLDPEQI
ncbi:HPr kinase/phosphorylase [Paracoccaceae bacterium GXU_MW_L88]